MIIYKNDKIDGTQYGTHLKIKDLRVLFRHADFKSVCLSFWINIF